MRGHVTCGIAGLDPISAEMGSASTLSLSSSGSTGRPSNPGAHGVIDARANAGMGDGASIDLGVYWVARSSRAMTVCGCRRRIASLSSAQMVNLSAYGTKSGNDAVRMLHFQSHSKHTAA
jgi:hypothetical protein